MNEKKQSLTNEGRLLWEPSQTQKEETNLFQYMSWLRHKKGLSFRDYNELWKWSVKNVENFWASMWEYFDIQASQPYSRVLSGHSLPNVSWFEGARLNYAQHIFRHMSADRPAIIYSSEIRPLSSLSWHKLYDKVAALAKALKEMGVGPGDRIVAFIPNIPEAVIAFLATASIGAIWSCCSPEFGSQSVINRFKQIEPKILIAADGYRYGGKDFNCLERIKHIQEAIPSLEHVILVNYLGVADQGKTLERVLYWEDIGQRYNNIPLEFEQVPFDHPLWILYSSGTTGLPKAIVQGHGGILIEHLKLETFHLNLKPGDRFFWFTTTGWMMWNVVVSGLLTGASIILFDGSPGYPNYNVLWQLAEKTKMTFFGTSASFLNQCMHASITPINQHDLSALKAIGSTGSPLSPDGFQWVYDHVKRDIWLASVSGGTDLCTAFVGGIPLLPVFAGELQGRALGANVQTFDPHGRPVLNEVGELVIVDPMPSMPLYFWGDKDGKRYRNTYFDMYPHIWRHGDWMKITNRGTCVIYGRSDSTLNRGGIRIGSSEIYNVVESMEEIKDSLVIDLEEAVGENRMLLFVVLNDDVRWDGELIQKIKEHIRQRCSPRHVPDQIYEIKEVPRTLNGKKLEVPIKRILQGEKMEKVVSKDSLLNPSALDYFIRMRQEKLNPFV